MTVRERILIVDDEEPVRSAYTDILADASESKELAEFRQLRAKLFNRPGHAKAAESTQNSFDLTLCEQAERAVEEVRAALTDARPFAVVFLDMRMPPGRDGAWAAARIRELDPAVEIVICTAYSDVDPGNLSGMVPPEDKLSYLQKPFHPHEIRRMAISLASKWRTERRIVKLAYFDALTGLANREQFHGRLRGVIEQARLNKHEAALLYLDLDNFKRVNDTLGHAAGDELLRIVGERMQAYLRNGDSNSMAEAGSGDIARLGGDEFVMILPRLSNEDQAAQIAQGLIEVLKENVTLSQHSLVITPSIGIARFPHDAQDAHTMLRNADLAMYYAKRNGAGTFASFDANMNSTALRRFSVEAKLQGALERNEFELHFQPLFDVRSGTVSGMEALLRWTAEGLGNVAPTEFVPIAEESGLILPIGEWVLRTACRQAKAWHEEGLPLGRVSINVSGIQFARKDFPQRMSEILRETGAQTQFLELEITETTVLNDEAWAEQALVQLRALGISVAIDDFGTGYSNFGRLRKFAVDRLKIDRSFVTGLNDSENDRAIATAIIAMSKSLRVEVTAEGVENFQQLLFLQENLCQEAQGYLFSRALPADQATQILRIASESSNSSRSQRLRALIR